MRLPGATYLAAACIILAGLSAGAPQCRAETLVAALSQETVFIRSNFTGASLTLFGAIEQGVAAGGNRRVTRVPAHINDPSFAAALVAAFREVAGERRRSA